jgi:hypothetical protein
LRQGPQLAANLARRERGEPTRAFGYRPKGLMSAIGPNRAVARIYGINLSGFIPWLLWRAFYLLYIPTLARKARLYLEWNWAMFFPPDIAHLRFTRTVEDSRDEVSLGQGAQGVTERSSSPVAERGWCRPVKAVKDCSPSKQSGCLFDAPAFGALRLAPQEFARETRIAAADQWYAQGIVSQAQAAELAQLTRAGFLSGTRLPLAAREGLPQSAHQTTNFSMRMSWKV